MYPPGKSGNPYGCPKRSRAQQSLAQFTKETVASAITELFQMSTEDLTLIMADPTQPAFRSATASVILRCKHDGDFSDIEKILVRCIGHVPQKLEGFLGGLASAPAVTVQMKPVKP